METETAKSDKKITKICHNEDSIMPMLHAVVNTLQAEVEEHEVGTGVDDFRRILGGIVILRAVSYNISC